MVEKFAFVTEDGSGRPNKKDMALIRSHSMKGKNVRVDSRRSKRREKMVEKSRPSGHGEEQMMLRGTPASDLACIKFPVVVDDHERGILYKILTISAASTLLYPVERCIDLHKVSDCVRCLASDAGFVYITLFTTCAINDFALHQPPTPQTIHFLRNVLAYVNNTVAGYNGCTPDTILVVVATLALMASMFQDLDAVGAHIAGLEQLVRLRGGREYLKRNPKTHFSIERAELSWCLSTGHRPIFFAGLVCWDPFFRGIQPAPVSLYEALSVDVDVWPKLAGAYKDLQHLSNLVNEHEREGTVMKATFFQSAIHSIQSRLLALDGELGDGVAECLRLGMLAVLTTTFRLPTRKIPHAHFASQLRAKLQSIELIEPGSRGILTWVLMMSIIAVFETYEPWIVDMWTELVDEQSWEAMRKNLQRFIWIRCIHDEPGHSNYMQLELYRPTLAH